MHLPTDRGTVSLVAVLRERKRRWQTVIPRAEDPFHCNTSILLHLHILPAIHYISAFTLAIQRHAKGHNWHERSLEDCVSFACDFEPQGFMSFASTLPTSFPVSRENHSLGPYTWFWVHNQDAPGDPKTRHLLPRFISFVSDLLTCKRTFSKSLQGCILDTSKKTCLTI